MSVDVNNKHHKIYNIDFFLIILYNQQTIRARKREVVMMGNIIFDEEIKKSEFIFINNKRFKAHKLKLGSREKIVVKDKQGNEREIEFYVTRDARLGKRQRWIYGKMVSDEGENKYFQVEIKLYEGEPHLDSIEIFRQAPPSHM